ncbi:helix-turn-helix domain-containing protein [Demetria terragena]|uniref:helix-turn-helix domain-containing protein n=1 Tax=Demetria terragena TaxID=63959 RepID=UPI0003A9470C|nr:helix-turn-helix transcriptional regulator [Demetria terragena]
MPSVGSGGPAAIRWLREVSGLTQRGLAEASGVSERTIRGLERGHVQRPHYSSLRSLAKAAGLEHDQREAFLRAWSPDRGRSLSELNPERPDLIAAETTIRTEIEERVLATWNTFYVGADRQRSGARSSVTIEARRDGIDTYCIPLLSDELGVLPQVYVSETIGCEPLDIHEFPANGLVVIELGLDRPKQLGEIYALEFALEAPAGSDIMGTSASASDRCQAGRIAQRVIDVLVVGVTFEHPPARVWEIEKIGSAPERVVGDSPLDRDHHAQVVRRHALPGHYGFRWEWE